MGDPLMVALFWVALVPSTIRWQHAVAEEAVESGQLLAWHPWFGGRIDLHAFLGQAEETTETSLGAWWTCWRLCLWSTRQN